MQSNIEKYKDDLNKLIEKGNSLHMSMQYECFPEEVEEQLGEKFKKVVKDFPNFNEEYQFWYSEAKAIIKQLLPDRLNDFIRHYEKPKPRKEISFENYRIEDYLQGLRVTRGYEKIVIVDQEAGIPHFRQQVAILKSVQSRFESSLFDIKQLVQADLFDSKLLAAQELLKKGFIRAGGAIAGVVLEKHLAQVNENHNITTRKKNPTISDFNDLLKKSEVLDTAQWRQIQRLGDIRNLCDHNKDRDPTSDEVQELIAGVEKITKTLF